MEEDALPSGWRQARDLATNHTYYYNLRTAERTWRPPPGTRSRALPSGWQVAVDHRFGAKYYFHRAKGVSQWDPPGDEMGVSSSSKAPFQPCVAFQGFRPGYLFKKGVAGLGYYLDAPGVGASAFVPSSSLFSCSPSFLLPPRFRYVLFFLVVVLLFPLLLSPCFRFPAWPVTDQSASPASVRLERDGV